MYSRCVALWKHTVRTLYPCMTSFAKKEREREGARASTLGNVFFSPSSSARRAVVVYYVRAPSNNSKSSNISIM